MLKDIDMAVPKKTEKQGQYICGKIDYDLVKMHDIVGSERE